MMKAPGPGSELSIQRLRKSFGPREVLHGIDLTIPAGEFVAVVGKSGCGKSTLLRLIAGLDKPTEGQITIDGEALRGLNVAARMMFQDARLLPWQRVLNNVGLGLKGNWQPQARQALAHVGLEERARDWPAILSGGQRQRVALARALVSNPSLMLLDEPLGALDALTRIEMQQLIETLWQEQVFTGVLVTHDIEEAVALANRVIVIDEGRVVMDVPINLPRPRHRGSATFSAIVGQILERVMARHAILTYPGPALEERRSAAG